MAPLTISVRGEATASHKAERALLEVEITSSGPDRHFAADAVARSSQRLNDSLRALSIPFSVPQKDTYNPSDDDEESDLDDDNDLQNDEDPSTEEDAQSDDWTTASQGPVYKTSVSFLLDITDFTILGKVVTYISRLPHARLHDIKWALTTTTRARLESMVRRSAVAIAKAKAKDYAGELELKKVVVVELVEDGETSSSSSRGSGKPTGKKNESKKKKKVGAGIGVEDGQRFPEGMVFLAEDIEIRAGVSCKFRAE